MALSDNICYIAIHGENHFLYFHFNIVIKYHVTCCALHINSLPHNAILLEYSIYFLEESLLVF